MSVMRWLGELLRYVTREGKRTIEPLHQSLIDATLNQIGHDKSRIVRAQLERKYLVSAGQVAVLHFYRPDELPTIQDPCFADKLFKVELFVEERRQLAHVTFYNGRIFSVELKKPRKFYNGKECRVGAVSEGRPKESNIAAIDRFEHGREPEALS